MIGSIKVEPQPCEGSTTKLRPLGENGIVFVLFCKVRYGSVDPNSGEGETGSSLGLNSQPAWHMRGSPWTVRDSMVDGSLGNETQGYPPHTSTHHMHLHMHIENRGERDRERGGGVAESVSL